MSKDSPRNFCNEAAGESSGYRVLEVFRYVPIEQPLLFCVVAMPVDARNFQ